jgi:hypothetical protein
MWNSIGCDILGMAAVTCAVRTLWTEGQSAIGEGAAGSTPGRAAGCSRGEDAGEGWAVQLYQKYQHGGSMCVIGHLD